ncbi:MAG: PriCT-2 domain-containing protein [Dechloromonas sp.]|uniref:PriCT-2 domain-containing protein n=1 Tax=Candidatus Dechloromonas phosphorivorans TaxID=2899244 RepID=A0A935K9M7_9RHOO|nr:PriCT-2 domain-containing protein [Candidatus Dechloromonas phosphorivorans]
MGVSLNTWGEVSQSGEGAHFIVGGTLPKSFNKSETLGVEGYSSGRFIALTGKKIKGTPDDIADNQAALDALYVECCGPILPSATGKKMLQSSTQANTQEPETPEAVARIRSALAAIPAKSYSEWVEMGMALHSTGWSCARPEWDGWSKTSDKYDPATQDSTWNSFDQSGNAAGKITLGSLFHLAKKYGWVDTSVPEYVRQFNAGYFVSNEGGHARIFREEDDQILKRRRLVAFHKESFLLQHANQHTTINGSSKPAAQAWLGHPQRRTFDRITFTPGQNAPANDYNLWRGFSVEAHPGNWSLLRQHIADIVCHGNAAHFDYVMGWMASAIQFPNRAGEVALVIRGGRGTGKGTLARAMLRLFGQHGMQINNGKHLTGNFNSHLRDCVMLNVDEGFWAGDKQAEGVLKGLVTEPTLTVEGKGRDAITAPIFYTS